MVLWLVAQVYTGLAPHFCLPHYTGVPTLWPFQYTFYMFYTDSDWYFWREVRGERRDGEWEQIDPGRHFRQPVSYASYRDEEHAWNDPAAHAREALEPSGAGVGS